MAFMSVCESSRWGGSLFDNVFVAIVSNFDDCLLIDKNHGLLQYRFLLIDESNSNDNIIIFVTSKHLFINNKNRLDIVDRTWFGHGYPA